MIRRYQFINGDNLQRQIDTIVENQAKFSEDMLMLKDALISLVRIVEQQGQQMKETDARLNALINLFERHYDIDGSKG